MARTAKGVRQFAAELEDSGCRVKWHNDYRFSADNQRNVQHRRSVEVQYYSDVDQFMSAKGGNGQPLRSMTAVRRYLCLEG